MPANFVNIPLEVKFRIYTATQFDEDGNEERILYMQDLINLRSVCRDWRSVPCEEVFQTIVLDFSKTVHDKNLFLGPGQSNLLHSFGTRKEMWNDLFSFLVHKQEEFDPHTPAWTKEQFKEHYRDMIEDVYEYHNTPVARVRWMIQCQPRDILYNARRLIIRNLNFTNSTFPTFITTDRYFDRLMLLMHSVPRVDLQLNVFCAKQQYNIEMIKRACAYGHLKKVDVYLTGSAFMHTWEMNLCGGSRVKHPDVDKCIRECVNLTTLEVDDFISKDWAGQVRWGLRQSRNTMRRLILRRAPIQPKNHRSVDDALVDYDRPAMKELDLIIVDDVKMLPTSEESCKHLGKCKKAFTPGGLVDLPYQSSSLSGSSLRTARKKIQKMRK